MASIQAHDPVRACESMTGPSPRHVILLWGASCPSVFPWQDQYFSFPQAAQRNSET